MLVSGRIDHRRFFRSVRAVVIDELHAFAGDDRGWHLLSVLSRIGRLSGRDIQRVGLSATVGNPAEMLEWLSSGSERSRKVIQPPPGDRKEPEVQVDYVGSLANAARVIGGLHRGEKRLVFCDSRSRVEQLALLLREQEIETFVSHSSLGAEERRLAEQAFAERQDCVIVATSSLELGIDVGDLDRVIQIDAPATVSSFLQRMGRTGRRAGNATNCLFLATTDEALLRAAALVRLWRRGYVEPVQAPPEPYHILAQQLMALCLQERGIGRSEWFGWLDAVPAFSQMDRAVVTTLVDFMIASQILWSDGGILAFAPEGEAKYGRQELHGPALGLHVAAALPGDLGPQGAGLRPRIDLLQAGRRSSASSCSPVAAGRRPTWTGGVGSPTWSRPSRSGSPAGWARGSSWATGPARRSGRPWQVTNASRTGPDGPPPGSES